jgi:hypothetical protein
LALCRETRGLGHIHLIFKRAVQECSADIVMMYLVVVQGKASGESLNGRPFYHRSEDFVKIDAVSLLETTSN